MAILDEPVSSLDPEGRRDVLNLIAGLRGEITVLFSTHVLADVERICDRVGILAHGRLVVEGPLAELLERYALPGVPDRGRARSARRRWTRSPRRCAAELGHRRRRRARAWPRVAVSDPDRAGREILAGDRRRRASASLSVARARPTLEDVFLRLTGDGDAGAAA